MADWKTEFKVTKGPIADAPRGILYTRAKDSRKASKNRVANLKKKGNKITKKWTSDRLNPEGKVKSQVFSWTRPAWNPTMLQTASGVNQPSKKNGEIEKRVALCFRYFFLFTPRTKRAPRLPRRWKSVWCPAKNEHGKSTPSEKAKPGPTLCARLRSRNAHGHLTRELFCAPVQARERTLS